MGKDIPVISSFVSRSDAAAIHPLSLLVVFLCLECGASGLRERVVHAIVAFERVHLVLVERGYGVEGQAWINK